ncbi:MAG: S8 family serine peptidase [Lapillicoccus sp.]
MTTRRDHDRTDPPAGPAAATAEQIRWWEPFDTALVTDRSEVQVGLIAAAFREAKIPLAVHRDASGAADYMYHPDRVLTRDTDAPRVYRVLGIDTPPEKGDRQTPVQPAGLQVVLLPPGRDALSAVDELDARLGVGVAVLDHLLHVCAVTWCSVTEPTPVTSGGPVGQDDDVADGRRSRVSVVDTGLLEEVVGAHDWLTGVEGDPEPPFVGHYTGHGTFIAGVVRAHAPRAEVRVESAMSIGGASFESDLLVQLTQALDWVPDVISLSAGTRSRGNLPLLSMQVFWEQRLRHLKGTVLVAAAGNDGDRGPFWPAAFPWVVSVGALDDPAQARAGFSNFGSWVDVYAPGTNIVNAYPTQRYDYREPPRVGESAEFPEGLAAWSGTSFAAPMVAGLVAARMTWSGESGVDSADSLLEVARDQAIPGVGAALLRDNDARPPA